MGFEELQQKIIDGGLCTGCGTCVGVCPISVLEMDNRVKPFIRDKCNNCNLCLEACPAIEFDFEKLRDKIYESNTNIDKFIGGYKNLYFGKSIDADIRKKAAGGGIVSSLLVSALENGMVDGVIVTKINEKNLEVPEVFIAKNREEIIEATQSKYVLAPTNTILRNLKKERGDYAFVGLPCHIHGIRNAQKEGVSSAGKIKFAIGIFCGINMRNDIIKYLLNILKVRKNNVKAIYFRSNEHAGASLSGGFLVITKNGSRYYIDKTKYQVLKYIFANPGCLYCIDHTNEFADISVGDMWLKSYTDGEEKLPSCIIIRTKAGAKLFENSDKIKFSELDIQDLIKCQSPLLVEKQIRAHTRLLLRKEKGLYIPNYNRDVMDNVYCLSKYNLKISPLEAFKSRNRFTETLWTNIVNFSQREISVKFLSLIPPKILRVAISQFIRLRENDRIIQPIDV